jgi:hypothetical protein
MSEKKPSGGAERLAVLTLTSKEHKDDGRFTRQFFKWVSDISADVAWLLRRGAIVQGDKLKECEKTAAR